MTSVLKSALLGFGLVVGASVAAQAQSVSSLPPGGAAPVTQSAVTTPSGSSQGFYPKPGGMEAMKEQPHQATTESDRYFAPYTTPGTGPKPN